MAERADRIWRPKHDRKIYSKLSHFNATAERFRINTAITEYLTWGKVAGKAVHDFNKRITKKCR
jgi:hypothetical protein